MKIQEVRDVLYRELSPLLPGWKLVKKEQGFARGISGGRQVVGVAIWDRNPEFKFSLVFCTRLDAAEALVHRVSGAQVEHQKESMTVMTQLEYFFPGERNKRIRVVTPDEVVAAVAALAPLLRDRALPLLDGMQTISALDRALNGDDPRLDTSDPTQRALHALAVAHLAHNPQFDQILARIEREMSGFLDSLKQQVAQLVAEIRKEPP